MAENKLLNSSGAYNNEIFKYVRTDSILILDNNGQLRRLVCPFTVVVIVDVPPLKECQEKAVIAVKLADNLIDAYIIEQKAFHHYNFNIIS